MSALDLAAGAYPVFLSPNYLTRYADKANDLVVSSGVDLRHRLYQNDPASLWQGENADDLVDEIITFGLWLPGMQGSRDVDFIALLNHNLKDFDIDLSDDNGGTYAAANYVLTSQAASYYIKNPSATVACDKIQITAHTTQTADQYKQIGGIMVAKATLQMSTRLAIFKQPPPLTKERAARLHNNTPRRNFVYRSDASLSLWVATCGFVGLTEDEADDLEAILNSPDPFIFAPEPGDRPSFWKLCQCVAGTFTKDYHRLSKSGGWAVSFDLEEVGAS